MSIILKHAAVMQAEPTRHSGISAFNPLRRPPDQVLYSSDKRLVGKKFDVRLSNEKHANRRWISDDNRSFTKIGFFEIEPMDMVGYASKGKGAIELSGEPFKHQTKINALNLNAWNWSMALNDFVVFDKSTAQNFEISHTSTVALFSDPFENLAVKMQDFFR
ncbi:MAG: hypothetical protein ACREBF_00630 [Candidatus Micrarchaeales archaeon]